MSEGTIHVPKDPMTGGFRRTNLQEAEQYVKPRVSISAHSMGLPATLRDGQEVTFDTRDAIAAVQNAGYLVYEIGELPEVVEVNGKPRLPAMNGQPFGDDRVRSHYEEGFRGIALARWYEAEAEGRQKRMAEIVDVLDGVSLSKSTVSDIAMVLVDRGWKR